MRTPHSTWGIFRASSFAPGAPTSRPERSRGFLSFTQKKHPSVDPAMFTKSNGAVIHVRDLPRRAVGEIAITGSTRTTATG